MTSLINPNNIDGTYPIAGQDNDSQGFRDNFTNIKNNFTYSAAEITDLQKNAILKGPLSGTSLNNDMLYASLIHPQLVASVDTAVYTPGVVGGITVNFQAGHFQIVQTNGPFTVAFSNWPPSGSSASGATLLYGKMRFCVQVTDVLHTMTLPPTVTIGLSKLTGIAGSTVTFPAVGTYLYEFSTYDNGVTVFVLELI